jgi:hypothetical protein
VLPHLPTPSVTLVTAAARPVLHERIVLTQVELIPVIAVPPGVFSPDAPLPNLSGAEMDAFDGEWPDEWSASEITGLHPITRLTGDDVLERFLEIGGRAATNVRRCPEKRTSPVFSGGVILRSGDDVLIEPTCCSDLSNVASWSAAAAWRGDDWSRVWIGHPWISARFDNGWIVLSGLHDNGPPFARWSVHSEELQRAATVATSELEDFASRLEWALRSLGAARDARAWSRQLAGLSR